MLITCEHCGASAPPSKRIPTWCKPCAVARLLAEARQACTPTPSTIVEPPTPPLRPRHAIHAYILANPEMPPAEVALALNQSLSTVWKVRAAMVKLGRVPKLINGRPRQEPPVRAPKPGPKPKQTPIRPVSQPTPARESAAVLDLLRRTSDPERLAALRRYYLKLRWLEVNQEEKPYAA